MSEREQVWFCKIGGRGFAVPDGGDFPMRQAVHSALRGLVGQGADFCFSGWGGTLNATERLVAYPDDPAPASPPEGQGFASLLKQLPGYDTIAALRAQVAEQQQKIEALEGREKWAGCGCMYDKPGDVCMVHSPAVNKVKAENADLQRRLTEAEGRAEDTTPLRRRLWLAHGCPMPALYGDDGEMQCNSCLIDFKRHTLAEIDQRLSQIEAKHLATPTPSPEET